MDWAGSISSTASRGPSSSSSFYEFSFDFYLAGWDWGWANNVPGGLTPKGIPPNEPLLNFPVELLLGRNIEES